MNKRPLKYFFVKILFILTFLLGAKTALYSSENKFCLEDTICAGAISENLLQTNNFESFNDSTIAAKYLYLSARTNFFGYLKASSHRKRLKKLNLNEDIKYCLTANQTDVVPYREDYYLKKLS